MRWHAPIVRMTAAVLLALLSWTSAAAGDQPVIAMVLWRGVTDAERGFKDFLKARGVAAQYSVYDCAKDRGRLPAIVAELERLQPDLIYTFGTTVTRAVAGTVDTASTAPLRDTPIVFNVVSDPLGAGIVTELSASGRNVTGVSHIVPLATQLTTLQQVKPVRRLAALYNPQEQNAVLALAALRAVAPDRGIELLAQPVAADGSGLPSQATLENALAGVLAAKPDFVYLPADSFLIANAAQVVTAATRAGVPVFSATEGPIRNAGAFMGVVSTYYSVGRFAAHKALQILQGGQAPGAIPIETLKRFSVLVNVATARRLDFFPPMSMLTIAEVVD